MFVSDCFVQGQARGSVNITLLALMMMPFGMI